MSKRCSHCGHENKDVASYCGNCGESLVASNFTSNFRDTGSSNGPDTSVQYGSAANGSGNAGTLCCGVIVVLFIIMLIMSMG